MTSLLQPPLPAPKSRAALAPALRLGAQPCARRSRSQRTRARISSSRATRASSTSCAPNSRSSSVARARSTRLPDWEVLPYDLFSPHPDIISERLRRSPSCRGSSRRCCSRRPTRSVSAWRHAVTSTAAPSTWPSATSSPIEPLRARLVEAGYASVSQVSAPGEFALRGSLFDVFPMGAESPLRVDLFDDEIEAIREFDPDTQRSGDSLQARAPVAGARTAAGRRIGQGVPPPLPHSDSRATPPAA